MHIRMSRPSHALRPSTPYQHAHRLDRQVPRSTLQHQLHGIMPPFNEAELDTGAHTHASSAPFRFDACPVHTRCTHRCSDKCLHTCGSAAPSGGRQHHHVQGRCNPPHLSAHAFWLDRFIRNDHWSVHVAHPKHSSDARRSARRGCLPNLQRFVAPVLKDLP